MMAIGFVYFINPYKIVPGGVYGASIVLHNIFPGIQVGTFGYMFDVPLMCIAMILLGKGFGSRTIIAALTCPLLMNLMSKFSYPNQAALEALDPKLLLGGVMDFSNHLMLTTLIGASVIGIGCGLIVRAKATSGGTDIIAMIIQKYFHIKFSKAIFMCDAVVVLSGLIVIGFGIGSRQSTGEPSIYLSLYSLIAIFVNSRVVAYVLNGSKDDKIIFIITERNLPELHRYILKDMDRTATSIKSSGLYTGNEKEMLFLVVSHREVISINKKIKEVDPSAFVVVTDAYDTYGEGFKPLPSMNDIQPE
ncbi:YitT family protein [Bacteroidaceae bacterium 14-104]|nr:YitT family protein [Phocaeicola oris]